MEYVIKGRKPAAVFRFFEEISAIPRPSYHEAAIADYLVAFAKERSLWVYRDALHNVLIKAPATKGREQEPPILLQGHTDMVCEKNGDTVHDFFSDPLKLWVDGEMLRAKGTTLGADNGIAVAMMLAMLDGAIESHPAYECLFTVSEETGMEGAEHFDYSLISARRLLNLDSESLGCVTAGCAGGICSELVLSTHHEPFLGTALSVEITGLIGGHSGEKIGCGRANANKLMGRLLSMVQDDPTMHLAALGGGSKTNAIPRECSAILATKDADALTDRLLDCAEAIAYELSPEDRGFTLTVRECEPEAVMLGREDTTRAIAILASAANGVLQMSHRVKGLVEFSRNLGVVSISEGEVKYLFSTRSAIESQLDASIAELDALAAALGARTRHYSRYPGWDYLEHSPLREAYLCAYRAVTGKEAEINVIHAGLECGLIRSRLPEMDVISIGPTMFNIHSPDEALQLRDTEIFWQTLEALLKA